jgi:protein-L-isoaspartate(D-aspartate) O-methyltransferase
MVKSMDLGIQADRFESFRKKMVDSQLRARGIRDERVLEAMSRVPRHCFVSEDQQPEAYEDRPLSIPEGQTVSQPYIVALTLEALSIQPDDRVLEIGTGSGYQTALLAEIARKVYSIERYPRLAEEARSRLSAYENVSVIVGDGSQGLAEQAPFHAIVVSAAAPKIPDSLLNQLADEGRMVIPVGPFSGQRLQLVLKKDGRITVGTLEGCRFVPMIGKEGYSTGW